jgi:hypothetical protein
MRKRHPLLSVRLLALVAVAALAGGGLAGLGGGLSAFADIGTPLTIAGYTVTPDPAQGSDVVTIALTVQNQSGLQICGPNDPRDCFLDPPPNAVHIEMPPDVQYVDNGFAGATDPNDMEGVAGVNRPGFNGPVDIVSTCSYSGSFLGLDNQAWDCTTPGLWPQETMTYSWRVRLPANPSAPVRTLTARVSQYPTNETPPTYDTGSVDAHIRQPDLTPVFYDPNNPPGQVLGGSGFTYNVEVLNRGDGRTNLPVDLRVDLPLALTSAGVNGNSSGTCTYHHPTLFDEERYVFCTFDQLDAGASATVSIAANAPSSAQTVAAVATADPNNNVNESDKSNNVAVIDTQVVQDTTPPTTTATVTPAPNGAGWNNSDVTVNLNATDNPGGSGVASITYSESGAQTLSSTTVSGAAASFVVSTEGVTQISYGATDNAGNVEAGKSLTISLDKTAPAFGCAAPDSAWHPSDVTLACTAADSVSGLANPADASFSLSTSVPGGTETSNASTGTHQVCDVAGNCATAGPITGIMVDKKAPVITCAAPDSAWHASDVTLACAASDGGSGLANPDDASFTLSTSVPAGTETSNAVTDSHQVCDAVGNCASAGPVAGIKVDKKPPTISIQVPASNGTYTLHQTVTAAYGCSDGGSGVATCSGTVANGAPIDTSSAGSKTFTVNATDQVGNASSATVSYVVAYGICALYDQTQVHQSGSTIPIKLQLCDASGTDVSSAAVLVTAIGLLRVSSATTGTPVASGNANPSNNFRYDATLGSTGGYIYNLKATGLAAGTWSLQFTVAGDPTLHSVAFQVR